MLAYLNDTFRDQIAIPIGEVYTDISNLWFDRISSSCFCIYSSCCANLNFTFAAERVIVKTSIYLVQRLDFYSSDYLHAEVKFSFIIKHNTPQSPTIPKIKVTSGV
jgi:hypothetical protein